MTPIKKDGTVRIFGDFSKTINQVIKNEVYPLPRIDEIFAVLSGGEKFTTLDLASAYWQMEVHEEDRQYLTVNTHIGLRRFTRLSFGVSTAPAIWRRVMDQVLQGLKNTKCYLDDIIITGKDDREHLENLIAVMKRLEY